MNEWAMLWTAILAAGNLIGVVLIVRPLLKMVGAQAVKAQKDTIDTAKSLNEADVLVDPYRRGRVR
jgi:hypothetical protein